jgi:hexosaminidase
MVQDHDREHRARSSLPPLLPAPIRALRCAGSFALAAGLPIALDTVADDADFETARALRDGVRRACGLALAIETHAHRTRLGPHIALCRRQEEDRDGGGRSGERPGGYRLRVGKDSIEAFGSGGEGLRYAVETLLQLVSPSGRIPCCAIDDAPDFAVRGIMLDVSRGKVPTLESLRQLVDLCAKLKLNALMLYTEHTFRFRRHPEIGRNDSPLDAESMRDLDGYAAARFVDLIPCLQSLGHMEHILKLPSYENLAETDAGWTVSPQEPGTYELLRDLYDEYLPNFRSGLVNVNCDEPWDLERGKSAARARELGPGGVYLEHVARLRELARDHGKRTLIWSDVVHARPERIPEIDRDLVLLDWWYEAEFNYDRVEVFAENGIEFFVCPGTSTWNSLFPRIENSQLNIARWADAGRRHGARGLINTDWGDFGHYNLQGNSFFAYAWGAQQSWSGPMENVVFDRAFSRHLFGDASGEIGRIYRALGAIHDAGFAVFNGSPLQHLFFDDLERAYFIAASKRGALTQCEKRLEKIRARIEAARERLARDPLTGEELAYAADASLLAVRKARSGLDYLEWRRRPERRSALERRRLARSLRRLADEQSALGRRLRRLWLARSAVSNLAHTQRRLRRSTASLRRAARALESNDPPAPPAREPLTPKGVLDATRRSLQS